MNTLPPSIAYNILNGKFSRQELIESIVTENSYATKVLDDKKLLNPKERLELISKVKNLDVLANQIASNKFNPEERKLTFERFTSQGSLYRYASLVPSLTTAEQSRIIRTMSDSPNAMFNIINDQANKFSSENIERIKDMLAGNPNYALNYITKYPNDTGRRNMVIDAISKNGGRSLEAFTEFSGFTKEERRKLLNKIAKHKSYLYRLLVQKQYSITWKEGDRETIVDTLLETMDLDNTKIVYEYLSLTKQLEDKLSPLLVAGKLAGKL